MRVLLIDNYDSYTFNLYQLIARETGVRPVVVRNDEARWQELAEQGFEAIVISPGPGHPDVESDFGICRQALLASEVPLLAVCLGHQGLARAFGGTVRRARRVMHGRLSAILHDGSELFDGLPQGFQAVRYHSLIVQPPVPDALQAIAWTADGEIMGLRHRHRPVWGVQFHPESICTEGGARLMRNFLAQAEAGRQLHSGRQAAAPPAAALRHADRMDVGPPKQLLVHYRETAWRDPEAAFLALFGTEETAWWLDSADAARGRFSFMGGAGGPLGLVATYDAASGRLTARGQDGVTSSGQGPLLRFVRERMTALDVPNASLPFDFAGGFVGYFGYELRTECIPGAAPSSPASPDALLLFADRFLAFDHAERKVYAVELAPAREEASAWLDAVAAQIDGLEGGPPALPDLGQKSRPRFRLRRPRERYLDDVARCREHLLDGNSYELCLTNAVEARSEVDPLTLYRVLRRINPAPFGAFLRHGGLAVLSSSPERFLRVTGAGTVEAKPIKGTAPRGSSPEEDRRSFQRLATSEKDRAENLMIVDLLRNDLGRVCEVGSVEVPHLMEVETFATVHQLVSTVRGRLASGRTALDAFQAAFPPGSMTGAPKIRSVRLLDEIEGAPRGVYSGALGYLSLTGAADLSVIIRTIVSVDGRLAIGTGGAIVADSQPEAEFEEMMLKARAPMEAVAQAHGWSLADCPIEGSRPLELANR